MSWREVGDTLREASEATMTLRRYAVDATEPLTLTAIDGEGTLSEEDENFEAASDVLSGAEVGDSVAVLEDGTGESVAIALLTGEPFEDWHFRWGGLRVGTSREYEPPQLGDTVVADFLGHGVEPGRRASGAGQTEAVGFVGGLHVDPISHRLNAPTAIRSLSIGDNAQTRGGRPPGWGHQYPAGGSGVVRRRPVGQSTWVGTDVAPGATEIAIFPAKDFRTYEDNTTPNVTLRVAGQKINYTAKTNASGFLCGPHPVGATELVVAEAGAVLPSAGAFRLRSLQGTYTGRELVLDGQADGNYKAGATTIVVRNVTQAEWDALSLRSVPNGGLRIARVVQGSQRFRYTAATYDSITQKATFTLSSTTILDKNVSDGAAVTVAKLTGVECHYVHVVAEDAAAGTRELRIDDVHPYDREFLGDAAPKVDPALLATISVDGGFLRVETTDAPNPPGPNFVDFPVERLEYESFDPETGVVRLADPLPRRVDKNAFVEIEGSPGLLRDRLDGQEVVTHRLTGVTWPDGSTGASRGDVVEYSPRYGHPGGAGSAWHIALDWWSGASGFDGYSTNISHGHATENHGDKHPGGYMKHMVTVPVSGFRLQKIDVDSLGVAILGAGFRGRGDYKYMLNVGGPYTTVKPPNIALAVDPDAGDDDDNEVDPIDPTDPNAGQTIAAILNVATVARITPPGRLKILCHNREVGAEEMRVFGFTGVSEGLPTTPNPQITGVTFDQTTYGPKTSLTADVTLPTGPGGTLAVASSSGFSLPATGFKGKLRAVVSGVVVARWTYTSKPTSTSFGGVESTFGSGTIPAGSLVEEDYAIGDFWVASGVEVSMADDVKAAALGVATGIAWGTDRAKGGHVGAVGPTGQPGYEFGARKIYDADDGKITSDLGVLATEAYADALAQGVKWKATVRAATTANITLSGTQTVDGVALVAGDRVLVKNQTNPVENGIYVVVAGAWARATDADAGSELEAATVAVGSGAGFPTTTQGNSTWRQITQPVTLGVSSVVWTEMSGLTTAGDGLVRLGSTVSVVAGDGLQANADSVEVKLDGATLEKSPAGLRVAPSGSVAPGGVYGYRVPVGQTARILEGQYFIVAGNGDIDVEGDLDLEGEILYVEEAV